MASTSDRVRSAGEIAFEKHLKTIVYPCFEQRDRENPGWWNTPYSRWDEEASAEENAANGALDPATREK